MNLVLYSGGQQRSNQKLHKTVVELAKKRKKAKLKKSSKLKLTYVPFCADGAETFFRRIMRRFRAQGVEQFFCFYADLNPSRAEIEEALDSDIIYLAGGNTFYFLKYLKKAGLLPRFKAFAKRGGVLAGLSAGALIMSPTIASAADPGLEPDENEVNLRDFKSMGLFRFEFSPHFSGSKKSMNAHLAYSRKTTYPVIAVADGGGIVIEGKSIQIIGRSKIFYRGKILNEPPKNLL